MTGQPVDLADALASGWTLTGDRLTCETCPTN